MGYGIRMLFENSTDIKIINTVTTSKQTLDYLKKTTVDVVLTTLDLPDTNGLTALRVLKKEFNAVGVIIFSSHPEDIYAINAIRAGASGFLSKTVTTATIKKAIFKVFKGGIYLSNELAKKITLEKNNPGGMDLYKKLSTRELEVLKRISTGKKNKDIAVELNVSAKTISTYKTRLMKKLNVSNIVELIAHGKQKK